MAKIESLESRLFLAAEQIQIVRQGIPFQVLQITGTPGNDSLTMDLVGISSNTLRVRLNGVQTEFTAGGQPTLLANTQIETRFQKSSSCMTCHALASVSTGPKPRLDFFTMKAGNLAGPTGQPPTAPFGPAPDQFSALDFVWSMREAQR